MMENNEKYQDRPFLARMIEEEKQLGERAEKLRQFIINNEQFKNLSLRKRRLMQNQFYLMMNYQFILRERILLEDPRAFEWSYEDDDYMMIIQSCKPFSWGHEKGTPLT